MKKLLIIEGSITEIKSEEFFGARDRIAKLERVVREYLKHNGDGRIADMAYEALGEPKPPMRKLKP